MAALVVTPLLATDMGFLPDQAYELAVFDLTSTIPLDDLKRFVTSLVDRAIIVVHANSDQADDVVKFVQSLAGTTKFEGLTMPTPRGIFIGCINRHLATGSASELS
jgi:hypothetical protein